MLFTHIWTKAAGGGAFPITYLVGLRMYSSIAILEDIEVTRCSPYILRPPPHIRVFSKNVSVDLLVAIHAPKYVWA
jgi:hypothetical protein